MVYTGKIEGGVGDVSNPPGMSLIAISFSSIHFFKKGKEDTLPMGGADHMKDRGFFATGPPDLTSCFDQNGAAPWSQLQFEVNY